MLSYRREQIIDTLKDFYFKLNKKPMPMYSVPHKHLKEFSTKKSDKKKNIYKIPPEMYRVKETTMEPVLDNGKAESDISEDYRLESRTIYQRVATDKQVGLSDFQIMKQIGKGSFGTIYLVVKKDNKSKSYAMKQLRKDVIIKTDALICTKLEKEVLKMSHHPFLVGLDFVFQTPVNIYFVMKYYKGGELYKHLLAKKRFSESLSMFYGAQIALALGELHKKNIIYRDMKPENILMDEDGYVALADFGLARIVDENAPAMTFCGTPEYIAPETIKGMGYNKAIDWWGLGVLLYEMMVGSPPFQSNNQHVLFQRITMKELTFPEPRQGVVISDAAKDIMSRLLKKQPSQRLGAKNDADEVVAHPFFNKIDIKKLLCKEIIPEYKPKVGVVKGDSSLKGKNIEEIDSKAMKLIRKNEVLY